MKHPKVKLIYILGNSRSGSTILSIFLGLYPQIHYVGELKLMEKSYKKSNCSCGEMAEECTFWAPFINSHPEIFNRPIESNNGIYRFVTTLGSIMGRVNKSKMKVERKLLKEIHQYLKKDVPETEMILDSSKSLKRFIELSQMKEVDVYPIYIERDLRSNLASFVKRGMGFISSYLRIVVNSKLISWYLSKNKIQYLKVGYESFATDPATVRNEILDFIGLDKEVAFERSMDGIHLISGSPNAIEGFKNDQTIKIRNEQKTPFTKLQLGFLKLLGI